MQSDFYDKKTHMQHTMSTQPSATHEHRRRAEREVAQERSQHAEVIETVEAQVSRMQEIFHAAGTPPATSRAPKQPGNAHEAASSIAESLRGMAEVTNEDH